ncbi:MAG: hypothetical protein IT294_09855 [Deltaproteobacteria bacterium]|nr:hypothetical protein [Deltaproteobacteria bacterium]
MNRAYLQALGLFVVALVVRIVFPEASYFGPDQVGILLEGRGVLQGHLLPAGPGVGWTPFKLGPLFAWVTAIGLLPRDRFSDVLLLVGVIHAAAVVGWWRLFAVVGGPARQREAGIAGWALALHPLSISSGCAPISTSIVLPTTLLFVSGIVRWVQARDPRGFVLACIAAAFVIQSHLTATLVLPMFLVGLAWKAPIGRRGAFGMLVGAVLAAPMVLPNILALGFGVFRHAGGAGAPYSTALWRALFLEGRVLEIAAEASPSWSDPGHLTTAAWSVFLVIGIVTLACRRGDTLVKALVGFGFALPTLCVALLPRGAFFLYFDSTVPFRAWLFATGVGAIAARVAAPRRTIGAAALVHTVALLAMIVPAGISVARRRAVAELGYARVNLSRTDLREPLGRSIELVGILTLGSLLKIGGVLDELGADPESIRDTLRGPWRWAAGDSVGVWIAESRNGRRASGASEATFGDVSKPGDARAMFLVLHDDDGVAVPASAAGVADQFRVYRFDDRLTVTAADDQRIVGRLARADGENVVMQVATDSTHRVARATSTQGPLVGTSIETRSGFEVWSASPETTEVTVELTPGERYVEQIRVPADAYAFVAAKSGSP